MIFVCIKVSQRVFWVGERGLEAHGSRELVNADLKAGGLASGTPHFLLVAE